MASSWAERIAWIVETYCDGNRSEFARKVKISPEAANKLYHGESEPQSSTLAGILAAWPEISARWLLTGTGARRETPREENRAALGIDAATRELLEAVRAAAEELREEHGLSAYPEISEGKRAPSKSDQRTG